MKGIQNFIPRTMQFEENFTNRKVPSPPNKGLPALAEMDQGWAVSKTREIKTVSLLDSGTGLKMGALDGEFIQGLDLSYKCILLLGFRLCSE